MGINLISSCHKCKVQIFHFRGEENETILPFYKKHSDCAKIDINNVQTITDNNSTYIEWCDEYESDSLQVTEIRNKNYWQKRCLLAEKCLEERPSDPDITKDQIAAWSEYNSFIKEFGNGK